MLPGLIDAHIHVLETGRALSVANVYGASSVEQLQDRLRNWLESRRKSTTLPPLRFVTGRGWSQEQLGRFPTRQDLDAVGTEPEGWTFDWLLDI